MKAIITKYYGPTNTKGSRIRVSASDLNNKFYDWDYELDTDENHLQAAIKFQQFMKWPGTLIQGSMPGAEYCHVFSPESTE